MNPRTIRGAAERKALKAVRKEQTVQPPPTATVPGPESKVISRVQYAANQANAQLSSGPTSMEGKAISSRNHTIHGLTAQPGNGPYQVLAGEDQAQYDYVLAA